MILNNFLDLSSYHAHTHHSKKSETLLEHTELVLSYFHSFYLKNPTLLIDRNLMWQEMFNRELTEDELSFLNDQFSFVVSYHDIGKINPIFQIEKMKNPLFKVNKHNPLWRNLDSKHSIFSSAIYLFDQLEALKEMRLFESSKEEKQLVRNILFNLAYLISCHHGNFLGFSLNDGDNKEANDSRYFNVFLGKIQLAAFRIAESAMLPDSYVHKEKFEKSFLNVYDYVNDRFKKNPFTYFSRKYKNDFNLAVDAKYQNISLETPLELSLGDTYIRWFIHQKILFSFLVTSDFYATHQYMTSSKNEIIDSFEFSSTAKRKLFTNFQSSPIQQSSLLHKDKKISDASTMNELRSVLSNEALSNFLKNTDKKLFFLEAPTGAGKTITSFNLASHMLQEEGMNKLMYVFPFNTLVDQTKNVIDHFLDDVCTSKVVNSATSEFSHDKSYSTYEKDKLVFDSTMFRYEAVLTSHIKFFDILFGTSRNAHLHLESMRNAVILLDEVQSYKVSSWETFITFLNVYAELFNWKVVIMSATLPPLDNFLSKKSKGNAVYLLNDASDYFLHPFFKGRVDHNFDYFRRNDFTGDCTNEILDDILKNHPDDAILIEVISRNNANLIYNELLKKSGRKVFKLDGDNTKSYRQSLLKYVNTHVDTSNMILVATQVIEAGVDIDFPVGVKDVAFVECEEQFCGRINRSNKKNGTVYYVNFTDEKNIYREDIRVLQSLNMVNPITYKETLIDKKFKTYYEQQVFKNLSVDFKNKSCSAVKTSDFLKIKNLMKQIDQESITLFLSYTHKGIKSEDIFYMYKDIASDTTLSFSERKIKLDALKEQMPLYSVDYKIFHPNSVETKLLLSLIEKYASDRIGDIFLMKDLDRFLHFVADIGEFFFDLNGFLSEKVLGVVAE